MSAGSKLPTTIADTRASSAYFIFQKSATTVAYVFMILLTIRFFRGRLDLPFAAACIFVSGGWWMLTRLKMSQYLQTYFDVFSRLEVIVPSILGALLSVAALFAHHQYWQAHVVASLELLFWLAIIVRYNRNKKKYEKQGYGPVPVGTYISPPASEIIGGDLILTNGQVARRLHESVGHAAAAVMCEDGLYAISSHMDRGCTLEPIDAVLGEVIGHYLVLKLANPLDAEQQRRMEVIAKEMVQDNEQWKSARNAAWIAWVKSLNLNEHWTNKLLNAYHCTGYDWWGTMLGRLAPHRWTCIGAALELYHRVGIDTNPYGTGLLGFGTTLLDPIMPVRFLNDPAFKLMMKKDEAPAPILLFSEEEQALLP